MKIVIVTIGLCVVFCGHALAQTNQILFPTSLLTLSGSHYESVTVNQISTNDVTITYEKSNGVIGIDTIGFNNLPPGWEKLCKSYRAQLNSASTIPTKHTFEKIVTDNGVTYSNVDVTRVERDGLTISYTVGGGFGVCKLDFDHISPAYQYKYGFDPKDLPAYRQQKAKLAAEQRAYQAQVQEQQQELDAAMKEEELKEARQQYDDDLKEQQTEAQLRMADAQERAAQALEDQNFQQQMNQNDQYWQQEEANQKLDDIDWDLRNH